MGESDDPWVTGGILCEDAGDMLRAASDPTGVDIPTGSATDGKLADTGTGDAGDPGDICNRFEGNAGDFFEGTVLLL
jgi:hypothetical protein